MPAEILAKLSYEQREKMWDGILAQPEQTGVFVAVDNSGELVAFVSGGAERGGDPDYQGELYAIYALRQAHGKGVGRALFQAMVEWLAARGYDTMLLWVLDTNPTRGFYERLGGVACREKREAHGEVALREIGYGWKRIGTLAHLGSC
ncbi:MAG TPA: GNAT family N-acetyltransferase [Symbiobacteriaceae bacterium]|nr:GNAT family N-acetyltransferase [Symbiobacteriaceae bacterium]